MNLILDKLSTILKERIGNVEFNTDFRIGILFEMLMKDKKLSKEAKAIQSLRLYYPKIEQIENIEKAYDDIIWFYSCGKIEANNKKIKNLNNKEKSQKEDKIYDYDYDDGYIYSAFLQIYRIDLQDVDYLHWWKFKALFNSLMNDTKIVEIMGYRAIDLGKIKDKQEKARYKKLQNIYGLPDMRTEAQKESDFGSAFW